MTTKKDPYLRNFVHYCKKKFGEELSAIVVYGSYVWGYFDKKKSDYDLFIIFKNKQPQGKEELRQRFKKISPAYFLTQRKLLETAKQSWAVYITLLKSGRVLFRTMEYNLFLKKLKKIDLKKNMERKIMEKKTKKELQGIRSTHGFNAVKWSFSFIRKRLQLLAYFKKKKLVWNVDEAIALNKNLLTGQDINRIRKLKEKTYRRTERLNENEKKALEVLFHKLHRAVIAQLKKP